MPSELEGWVDLAQVKTGQLELAGWAADVKRAQIPQEIWIYINGEFFHSGELAIDRPDVSEHFGNPVFQQSGFHYTLPLDQLRKSPSLTLRVFAVSEEGRVSELQYPPLLRDVLSPAIRLHASDQSSSAPASSRN